VTYLVQKSVYTLTVKTFGQKLERHLLSKICITVDIFYSI
jgi:hypothetical protein